MWYGMVLSKKSIPLSNLLTWRPQAAIPCTCNVYKKERTGMCVGTLSYATVAFVYLTGSIFLFHNNLFTSRYAKIVGDDPYYRLEGNRTQLQQGEFFKIKPSNASLQHFFSFDNTIDAGDNVLLNPLWNCSIRITEDGRHLDDGRNRKLIFLHIPRTAGSTIRALLRAYSDFCHAGFAVVNRCVDLSFRQLNGNSIWRNGRESLAADQDCVLMYIANRTSGTRSLATTPIEPSVVSTALLQIMQVDILSGQLSIGSDEGWYTTGSNGKQVNLEAQYVAFFRQPLHKFVSETMFHTTASDSLSIEEAVALVNSTAFNAKRDGRYYEKYSNYLITPEQKDFVDRERVKWSPERRVNLTLTNLLKKSVLVGVVERMPESMQLLKYVLDGENETSTIFQFFSSTERVSKLANVASNNRTEAIVKQIRQDAMLLASLEEYLKYETQIYEFAVQIHERQYHGYKADRSGGTNLVSSKTMR